MLDRWVGTMEPLLHRQGGWSAGRSLTREATSSWSVSAQSEAWSRATTGRHRSSSSSIRWTARFERQLLSSINRWTQLGLDAHYNFFVGGFRFDERIRNRRSMACFRWAATSRNTLPARVRCVPSRFPPTGSRFRGWARPFELSVDRLICGPQRGSVDNGGDLELKGVDVFDWARVREARIDTWNNLCLPPSTASSRSTARSWRPRRGRCGVAQDETPQRHE